MKEEKISLSIALVLMFFFLSLIIYGIKGLGIDLPTCFTSIKPYDKGRIEKISETEYEIYYVARMWYFDPQTVEIPVGAKVRIYLTSADVTHGFQILGTNVNLMAIPGTVNYYEVRFDKEGIYEVICNEYCGLAHQNMIGKIIVKTQVQQEGENSDNNGTEISKK